MRFIVFAFNAYYAKGGAEDIQGCANNEHFANARFDTLVEAWTNPDSLERKYDYIQLLDTETMRVIRESNSYNRAGVIR